MTDSNGMICTCDPSSLREAVELRLDVQRRLGAPNSCTAWVGAVFSLAWHFGMEIDIASDMWFGVGVSSIGEETEADDGDKDDDEEPEDGEYIECDWPFDGVFWLWRRLVDRNPEKVALYCTPSDVTADRVRAEALLAEYESLKATSRAHDYACPACAAQHVDRVSINPMPKRCDEGKALWDAYFPPLRAIRDMWGMPPYDDAPWMWGARR